MAVYCNEHGFMPLVIEGCPRCLHETIADLRAQLQRAEEERDGYARDAAILRNLNKQAGEDLHNLKAERDAAVKRGVKAVWLADKLTTRYVGYSARCRHLKCFTAAPGLIVEHCVACKAEAAERRVREPCGGCNLKKLVLDEAKEHLGRVLAWVPDNEVRRNAARFLRMGKNRIHAAEVQAKEGE